MARFGAAASGPSCGRSAPSNLGGVDDALLAFPAEAPAAAVWRDNERARCRQLREDARRPLAVNLAEGLALSEFLSTFTGAAKLR